MTPLALFLGANIARSVGGSHSFDWTLLDLSGVKTAGHEDINSLFMAHVPCRTIEQESEINVVSITKQEETRRLDEEERSKKGANDNCH